MFPDISLQLSKKLKKSKSSSDYGNKEVELNILNTC